MREKKNRRHPIASALLALMTLAMMMVLVPRFLSTCSSPDPYEWETSGSYSTSYYSGEFAQHEGRASYIYEGVTHAKTGVDVSEHQGPIDWTAVAGDGISYAMIRVGYRGNTEGYLHQDELFEQNLAAAQEAGIECGVYFYSQAISADEAREEAAFVLGILGSRELSYPVAFDFELSDGNRIGHLDGETATACVRAFCDAISEGGYRPMLYGNAYDLQRLYLSELEYPVWYAEYGMSPSWQGPISIWQYTSNGVVDGIGMTCDLNLDLSQVP